MATSTHNLLEATKTFHVAFKQCHDGELYQYKMNEPPVGFSRSSPGCFPPSDWTPSLLLCFNPRFPLKERSVLQCVVHVFTACYKSRTKL